jgi:hypothetical protein
MRAVKNSEGPRFWEGVGKRERNELTLVPFNARNRGLPRLPLNMNEELERDEHWKSVLIEVRGHALTPDSHEAHA